MFARENSTIMFYQKKIQLWLALLSLLSLSLVKPAGLTEMPTLARNFNASDMSSSGTMSTEEVVGSCVLTNFNRCQCG